MSKQITGWYENVFKAWQVKTVGPKPTAAQLDTVHRLGARPGKQALASAMALRDCGVTGAQIVMACGAPQLNKMRGFITDGLLKREAVPPTAVGHTVYKLTLTPKGATRIKNAAEKPEAKGKVEPKAKAKAAKPRKAKAPKPVASEPVVTDSQNNIGMLPPVESEQVQA